MKAKINIITIFILLTIKFGFSQTSYIWVGGVSGNFTTAANWSPIRLNGQVSDILIFNTGSTISALNVQQQTIGQLIITNNTHVIFTPASGNPKVISINGGTGDDLKIDSGCIFEINGSTPQLGFFLKTGTTGSIYGSVIIAGNQAHYLNSQDFNSLVFHSGSTMTQNTPGYVFTNTGTANAVIFEDGSTISIQNNQASSPFGLSAPNSKVILNQNSTFIMQVSNINALSLNGRTYGNLIINTNSNVSINESFSSNVTFNNISVNSGSSFHVNNSSSSFNPSFNVKGDLNIDGDFTFENTNTNNFEINLCGVNTQSVNGNGIISLPASLIGMNIINPAGVTFNRDITASCPVNINSSVNLNSNKLYANTTLITGATISRNSGYVVGNLTKYFSNLIKSQNFEVGTSNGYSPVIITFNNISQNGYITVCASSAAHTPFHDSTILMKRYWTILNDGVNFDFYSATFKYLSNDFNTNFHESTDEATMQMLNFVNNPASARYLLIHADMRDTLNNLIGINNIKIFGDFTTVKNEIVTDNFSNNSNSIGSLKTNNQFNNNTPKEFGISQNYPNPFNPSTKIDYQLPFASYVTIKLYDINGKEVQELTNGNQNPGSYTIQINARNLASGVYFYKILATSGPNVFERTLKLVVTK